MVFRCTLSAIFYHYVLQIKYIIMGIIEFYKKFGRLYPLSVVKTAYGYTQNQHEPKIALSTASTMYGAQFETRPFHYTGYMLTKVNKIAVYRLQTETLNTLNCLTVNDCNKGRYQLSAMFGENCDVKLVSEFEPQSGSIFGFYAHRNRYVTIVRLQTEKHLGNVQQTANLIARYAMAAYTDYVHRTRNVLTYNEAKLPTAPQTILESERLERFLHTPVYLAFEKKWYEKTSVEPFINTLNKRFNTSVKITEIHLFGL